MTLVYILLGALAIFLITISVILMLVGPILLLQPRRRRADFYRKLGLPVSPVELHLPCEKITLTVEDGLKLQCWLIKSRGAARGTVLYLHGVGDCKIDGLRLANLLSSHGFNVFLYDSRRHGESDGTYCTYGFHEKHDVTAILDYLQQRNDLFVGRTGVFGTSMGAAVALQAAAIDDRIAGVVAENSFATLRTIFDDYQKRMVKLPFHFLRNLVILRSEWLAEFKAREVSPLRAVIGIRAPILFIYGGDDHLINYRYTLSLFQYANEPKEIFPVEKARHNDVWTVAGKPYEEKVLTFFEKALTQ